MKTIFSLLSATVLMFTLSSCGAVDAVDCHGICSRYADCFDKKYDVDSCTKRCTDSSQKDSNYESTMKQCNDCIDDKSCSSATFSCGAQCGTVVP